MIGMGEKEKTPDDGVMGWLFKAKNSMTNLMGKG